MKNILLLAAVSLGMTVAVVLSSRPVKALPEITLPAVTIRDAKPRVVTLLLPEVVITAKMRKA